MPGPVVLALPLSVLEVANQLHVSPDTVERYIKDGYLKAFRVGNRGARKIHPDDLVAFIENSREKHVVNEVKNVVNPGGREPSHAVKSGKKDEIRRPPASCI
jgi:excisionase family DNA binding protein